MKLTRNQLYLDLLISFYDARKHKSLKPYVKTFEENLTDNINTLCDELFYRKYTAKPSKCFIIECPKKREIFAADFRDRIVHHLFYNYTINLFESTFIYDSYSCRKNKGTHFGIDRLEHHIKSESHNYQIPTYCLKMDIKGYFMNINRNILYNIAIQTIDKHANKYEDILDINFIKYLTKTIVLLNPIENSIFYGDISDYYGLPYSKTLHHSPKDCGLPIGNLSSQLMSNVYLNQLDQFCKRTLKCKHYGRYVDDFYIVSSDKEFLKSIIQEIEIFLYDNLGLTIQKTKTQIKNIKYGVEFLGAYLLPYRRYISNASLNRMKKHIKIDNYNADKTRLSNISRVGILSHYKSHNIIKKLFYNI